MLKSIFLPLLFLANLFCSVNIPGLQSNEHTLKHRHSRSTDDQYAVKGKLPDMAIQTHAPEEKKQLVWPGFVKNNEIIETTAKLFFGLSDTVIIPTADSTIIPKVAISNGKEGIEFTPYAAYFNGGFIQPINRATNKGVSTSFYLPDTSSWIFYTNATRRITIQGDGRIVTRSPLLINNATADNESALRVNGIARIDSSISIRAESDTKGFISLDRNIKSIFEPDDGISPYTFTPTQWANGGNIPAFRLRHPLNVTNIPNSNKSIFQDFVIVPYQYGTAIQFNGVVECWVGEWSIHRGNYYYDVEAKGNGWGGVLWVGDDNDLGGIRATARNNLAQGGNVTYGEISAEKFGGAGFGDFRLRLPSTENTFQFVYGERGSNNVIAKVSNQGIFIPKLSSVAAVQAPEKGQVLFDSSASLFKGYDGTQWITFNDDGTKTGVKTASSNGTDNQYSIAHGLGKVPSYFNVLATSADAASISYVTADATNLIIHYTRAPSPGVNNLSWTWQIKN